jgi:hypothetical protein
MANITWQELLDHLSTREIESRKTFDRYTPEFVQEALGFLAKLLAMYIALTENANSSPLDVAGRRIGVYLDLLWKRLSGWEKAETDLLAWTTRNLLEVHFWTQFITQSAANAQEFISEADIDQRELFEVYLRQQGNLTDIGDAAIRALADLTPGKRERIGTPDPLLYKECSKYVHVTSWIVNGYDRHIKDDYARLKFIAFSLHYFTIIVKMLLESNSETRTILYGQSM